jgi:hypothetical protein
MCVNCGGEGFIDSYYKFVEKSGRSTIEDYKWREEACTCDKGQCWLEHQINVGYGMATRMDKFISENLGKRTIGGGSGGRRAANSQDLIEMYLSGKRSFQDNIEVDWTKV